MPRRPSKALLRRPGRSSVPVAKPICVSPLECPSENRRWAWEGDESPLASSQLSCCGVPPPSYHGLPSSPLLVPPDTPPPPSHTHFPRLRRCPNEPVCSSSSSSSAGSSKDKKGEILKVSGRGTVPHEAAVVMAEG